jgi:hypothetical protein
MKNLFSHNYFLGYVNEVTPQYIRIHFPSSRLLQSFYHEGYSLGGGHVGCFVVIEGEQYGFLARITEVALPDSERKSLTEKSILEDESAFHPSGKAELLLSFDVYDPSKAEKTVGRYPHIGSKVYACSDELIGRYVSRFGGSDENAIHGLLGKLVSNNVECNISLDALFGRHCAVLGTTGGGKSWTVARLIEMVSSFTSNKCILIDATGEYGNLPQTKTIQLGTGKYIFKYENLSLDDLYYLLRPSSKTQLPKLMEAIRSLKMARLDNGSELASYYQQNNDTAQVKLIHKEGKEKRSFQEFYYRNINKIEDKYCDFDFSLLARQITNECVWDVDRSVTTKWGGRNDTDVANCISLISRVNNLMSTAEYNDIFGFKNVVNTTNGDEVCDVRNVIESFLNEINGQDRVLRLDFSQVSFDYQVREILVNAIGGYLLDQARCEKYKSDPIVVFVDEAHQFLNKRVSDEYFSAKPLDSFEQVSKEARKYGLFLCIATQMPRDIPLGTLSQMGTFIVHRLINEQDKKAIESAASSLNRSMLSFLPTMGAGEALLMGVDFPMPLLLRVTPPVQTPQSGTPKLSKKQTCI